MGRSPRNAPETGSGGGQKMPGIPVSGQNSEKFRVPHFAAFSAHRQRVDLAQGAHSQAFETIIVLPMYQIPGAPGTERDPVLARDLCMRPVPGRDGRGCPCRSIPGRPAEAACRAPRRGTFIIVLEIAERQWSGQRVGGFRAPALGALGHPFKPTPRSLAAPSAPPARTSTRLPKVSENAFHRFTPP